MQSRLPKLANRRLMIPPLSPVSCNRKSKEQLVNIQLELGNQGEIEQLCCFFAKIESPSGAALKERLASPRKFRGAALGFRT
jgi:hypothetical protein